MDTSTASRLCDPCWHIFDMIEANRNKPERERLVGGINVLWHPSPSNCALCITLPYLSSTDQYEVRAWYYEQYVRLRLIFLGGMTSYDFTFCRVRDDETLFTICQMAALEDYTGNDSVLKVAGEWMSRCTSHHGRCVKNDKPQWYPD